MGDPGSIMSCEMDKPASRVLDVNLMGPVYGIKLFLHHVQKNKSKKTEDGGPKARIVITSSEAGLSALPTDPIYATTKHGVCFSSPKTTLSWRLADL